MVQPIADEWQFQVRVVLHDAAAEVARRDVDDPAIGALADILKAHSAALVNQFDAFAGYVAEAEREGVETYPLYKWTKAVIEDPVKKEKYLKVFTLTVDGEEVYAKDKADALEAALATLAGGDLVVSISKYDSNPKNNPQTPPQYR